MSRERGVAPPEESLTSITGIAVDVDDLSSFRVWLSRELSQNLGPAGRKIIDEHVNGPGFGWATVSRQVAATHARYGEALKASINNMRVYLLLAEALISGLQEVATNYAATDIDAQLLVEVISSKMNATTDWDPNQPRGMSL